jgi:hypothetical protein
MALFVSLGWLKKVEPARRTAEGTEKQPASTDGKPAVRIGLGWEIPSLTHRVGIPQLSVIQFGSLAEVVQTPSEVLKILSRQKRIWGRGWRFAT